MANKSFAHLNNFTEISPPEQSPQDITTSFSELLLSEELPIDYMISNTNNTALEIVSDAETASILSENSGVSSTVKNNIDENIFDIDLTQIEDIPEMTQSDKNSKFNTISISQRAFQTSGTNNIASASASVRAVNSPNIVNKSFTISSGVQPTQSTDSQDVKIVDDLLAIKLSEIAKLTPKINPANELAIDDMLGDKAEVINLDTDKNSGNFKVLDEVKGRVIEIGADSINSRDVNHIGINTSTNNIISSIDIDSKNNSLSEDNIDDLNKANSNIVSQAADDVLILETDFAPSISHSDDGSSYSIEVSLNNGIATSASDNLFYLGKNEHILGGEADDTFFLESGDGNILFGGGTDQF